MKYVVSWTFRSYGSAADNEAAPKRILELYSKWTPPEGMQIHHFLGSIAASGGYMVLETDNPTDLAETIANFGPYADYRVDPVLDVADAIQVAQASIKFRDSIG